MDGISVERVALSPSARPDTRPGTSRAPNRARPGANRPADAITTRGSSSALSSPQGAAASVSTAERLWHTWSIPSNALIFLQGVPGSLPWGMVMVFFSDYLAQVSLGLVPCSWPSGGGRQGRPPHAAADRSPWRGLRQLGIVRQQHRGEEGSRYGTSSCWPDALVLRRLQDKGLGVAQATLILMLFGIGGGVGTVLGGVIGQALYNRRKEYMVLFFSGGVVAGDLCACACMPEVSMASDAGPSGSSPWRTTSQVSCRSSTSSW